MKTEIDQLEQEVHRLTEELSNFDARSSGGNGRLAKRQKMSMSTEQLAQVVAQAEETVERLRRVKEGKVAERENLNARLTADA
jgi:cell division septum initiation protein DivIVA